MRGLLLLFSITVPVHLADARPVTSTDALVKAVEQAGEGETVEVAAGTYSLSAPLRLKTGITLTGAGVGKTIITHAPTWTPPTKTLPDPEMRTQGMDTYAYLLRLEDKADNVTVSHLTLRGPHVHGAVYGFANKNLHLHDLRIEDVLWSGIRTFKMNAARIHDCHFVNAGGRWKRGGIPGDKGGITGGAIFAIWMSDSEISHNRFSSTHKAKAREFYGVKVRQGRRCRIHHNTIEVNFSVEMPFENDEDVEVDHNICYGTISIPKHAGGAVPKSGRTFHIHHNYMRHSYSIEFVRNGVEIDHNLFDFDLEQDGGNLISAFGKAPAGGPAEFHNNLISNPGRGVIWMNEPYTNLVVRNNHVITRTTVTPRRDGLFGLHRSCAFRTIRIADNIIECRGQSRPLLRNQESSQATITNNRLTNVSGTDRYDNAVADRRVGLEQPLSFRCGVHGEVTVDGWNASKRAQDESSKK